MAEQYVSGLDGTYVHYAPEVGAVINTNLMKSKGQPTRTFRQADLNLTNPQYMMWGSNNQLPFDIVKSIHGSASIDPVIKKKVDLLTSGGIMYGNIRIEDGVKIYEPRIIPEIEDFLSATEIDRFIEEKAFDHYTFNNTFCETVVDVGRRIVAVYNNDATECRLGLQNREGRRRGMIDKVYVSADWRERQDIGTAEVVDAVDPYYDVTGQIREGRAWKYIIPDRLQSRGLKYYQRSPIENLKDAGWIDIANSIPKWKMAIMENQITIKYHVEVEEGFWMRKYPKWNEMSESKRKEVERKEMDAWITFFKNKQGASKLSKFKYQDGKEYSEWKITPVGGDKPFGENAYIEDITTSEAVIARALSMPPALVGMTPGKGMGAGSGSDVRMHHNSYVLGCKPDQRKILRPVDYAFEVNGWKKKYGQADSLFGCWFENFFIATLDHGRDTKKAGGES